MPTNPDAGRLLRRLRESVAPWPSQEDLAETMTRLSPDDPCSAPTVSRMEAGRNLTTDRVATFLAALRTYGNVDVRDERRVYELLGVPARLLAGHDDATDPKVVS